MAFGIGGGSSGSKSSSQQNQRVWAPQGDALGDMYSGAGGIFNQNQQMNPQFQNFMSQQINPMMMGMNPYMMQGFQNQMGGGAMGATGGAVDPALRQSLQNSLAGGQSNMSKMYSSIVGGNGNSYVDPIVDDMYSKAWDNLDQGAFKQSAQGAARSGNMGNYNRQMDNAQFASNMMNDVGMRENQLRGAAYDTDLNWKMKIAGQADDNLGKSQDRAMGLLGAGDMNQQGAMNSGNMMQNFMMGQANPFMAMQQFPWMNLNSYANSIGDPTVLSSAKSSGSSNAFNLGMTT